MGFMMLWLSVTGQNLEWTTSDGRTFLISGDHRILGCWERFFRSGEYPARVKMGVTDAQEKFESANILTLYTIRNDEVGAEQLTREQVFDRVEQMFPGSVRRK